MVAPSPFDIARGISDNVGRSVQAGKDETAIDRILMQAQQSGNPEDLQNVMGKLISSVSPERRQDAMALLSNRMQTLQANQQRQRQVASGQNLGYDPDAPAAIQKSQYENRQFGNIDPNNIRNLPRDDLIKLGKHPNKAIAALANDQIKQLDKKPEPDYEDKAFKSKRGSQKAEKLQNAESELEKAKGRGKLYDQLEDLTKKTSGLNFNPYSQDAQEMNALGLAAIEPVLKIFNPVGAIPDVKIKRVAEKFAPSFMDLSSTKRGKIKALRFINDQAINLNQNIIDLYGKHGSKVPENELNEAYRQAEEFIDVLDKYDINDVAKFGESEQQKSSASPDEIKEYIRLANGDINKAKELAVKDGKLVE